MGNKKSKELAILRKVFSKKEYPNVVEQEKPDFVLKNTAGTEFGVETTEFYTTGSTARIKNVENYLQDLLKSGKFRHGDDVTSLRVEDFKIHKPDGEYAGKARGVFMEAMPLEERMRIFESLINGKNRKYSQYSNDLAYIDLLIHDSDGLFGLAKSKSVATILMQHLQPRTVEEAKFNDIILIFQDGDYEYALSVLQNIFIANVMSAVGVVQKYNVNSVVAESVTGVDFVAAILEHNGYKKVKTIHYQPDKDTEPRDAIQFRNAVVCCDDQGFDTFDYGPITPSQSKSRRSSLPEGLPQSVKDMYGEFLRKYTWVDSIFIKRKKLSSKMITGGRE